MKKSKKRFILIEIVLAVMVIVLIFMMFREKYGENPNKVSVIIQDSDDNQWAAFKYGLKKAVEDEGIDVFVVNTGEYMTAGELKNVIEQEIENGADAVIVQPVSGQGTGAMLKKIGRKVPVMLVESGLSQDKDGAGLAVVEPDYYAMGTELAEELLKDYDGNIAGKKLGIIAETQGVESVISREKGFRDALKNTDAEIVWSLSDPVTEDGTNTLKVQPRVDIIIALDDSSLVAAGECAYTNDLGGAVVYGIGHSTESVYYLDTGIVECLVVPNEFQMGYQSMTEVADRLQHYFHKMQNNTISHTVFRKETLFSKENQEILFTMSQ